MSKIDLGKENVEYAIEELIDQQKQRMLFLKTEAYTLDDCRKKLQLNAEYMGAEKFLRLIGVQPFNYNHEDYNGIKIF